MKILCGKSALSKNEVDRLIYFYKLKKIFIKDIKTEYIYFLKLNTKILSSKNINKLDKLLNHPSILIPKYWNYDFFLVTPKIGVTSFWSKKVKNIIFNCKIKGVVNIDRGIAYYIQYYQSLTDSEYNYLYSTLYNPMIEIVWKSFEESKKIFNKIKPNSIFLIDILKKGKNEIKKINKKYRLMLSKYEINYLFNFFRFFKKNPTDIEIYSYAQINSEHCKHNIFNAFWTIDNIKKNQTLLNMIKNTYFYSSENIISAYKDNSAIIKGNKVHYFYPDYKNNEYEYYLENKSILAKVETHNYPTAISPFSGAASGSGGEIRDEVATGRGGKSKVGIVGFSVSNLYIPGFKQIWEKKKYNTKYISNALNIIVYGSLGTSYFNNEFGRPTILGYFRTYEKMIEINKQNKLIGYHKPIMICGGLGEIKLKYAYKKIPPINSKIIILGNYGLNIGLGGASSSSSSLRDNIEFNYSGMQKTDPEIQRRCQEVINTCCNLGNENPIYFIHDIGAGGISNAVIEMLIFLKLGGIFQVRNILNSDFSMSPLQIWCNETQERYLIVIPSKLLYRFQSICLRENVPYSVIGKIIKKPFLILKDKYFGNTPIFLPIKFFLNKKNQIEHKIKSVCYNVTYTKNNVKNVDFKKIVKNLLYLPCIAEKTYLITINDRSVTGVVVQDQMVGPWQIPVADCAVILSDYKSYRGEVISLGERSPISVIDCLASTRISLGETITNISGAYIKDMKYIKLFVNWMVSSEKNREDLELYNSVQMLSKKICNFFGLTIIGGKDSTHMKTSWYHDDKFISMTAPLTVIMTAFSYIQDVRRYITPQLNIQEENILFLIDLGEGNNALGGSSLSQILDEYYIDTPDLRNLELLKNFFYMIQNLIKDNLVLAYHDRSDGGLLITLLEMAFSGNCGLYLDMSLYDHNLISGLFNEELGAVIQIKKSNEIIVRTYFEKYGLKKNIHLIGIAQKDDLILIKSNQRVIFQEKRSILRSWWSKTTWNIQRFRDNPNCADQEYIFKKNPKNPGLSSVVTFNFHEYNYSHFNIKKTYPKVAILRDQGTHSYIETALAFKKVGFSCIDVHMQDLLNNKKKLSDFQVLVACGGFSYGDVLGSGQGWSKVILFNSKIRDEFFSFFNNPNTLSLGICNGCQMFSNLYSLIPGAKFWPNFTKNSSNVFESRFVLVKILKSPSLFFEDMTDSILPIVVAHGEGRIIFRNNQDLQSLKKNKLISLQFVDYNGNFTEKYPENPNGSIDGITAFTNLDGRITVMMPHPERVFRSINNYSWNMRYDGEYSPWIHIFYNARKQFN
ncbi:MAG: phosphoribosylformylglycinamidine synthase [Arsenophonus sp.]|nr:MAG: phosphoribosylformylglycinamidine synthase [Arsenophonus sp.]